MALVLEALATCSDSPYTQVFTSVSPNKTAIKTEIIWSCISGDRERGEEPTGPQL